MAKGRQYAISFKIFNLILEFLKHAQFLDCTYKCLILASPANDIDINIVNHLANVIRYLFLNFL